MREQMARLNFFIYVRPNILKVAIYRVSNYGEDLVTDFNILTGMLNDLHANAAPQNFSCEIHKVTNTISRNSDGPQFKLNDAVMRVVDGELAAKGINDKKVKAFVTARATIEKIIDTQKLKITPDQLEWVLGNLGAGDKLALQKIVILLKDDPKAVGLWANAFVKESLEAYKGSSDPESCEKGVRERVITSLRDALKDVSAPKPYMKKILKLFEGPEGEILFTLNMDQVLKNYNYDSSNVKRVVDELRKKGFNGGSNLDAIKVALRFMMINDLGSNYEINKHKADVSINGAVENLVYADEYGISPIVEGLREADGSMAAASVRKLSFETWEVYV